jgi:hypothetical protein
MNTSCIIEQNVLAGLWWIANPSRSPWWNNVRTLCVSRPGSSTYHTQFNVWTSVLTVLWAPEGCPPHQWTAPLPGCSAGKHRCFRDAASTDGRWWCLAKRVMNDWEDWSSGHYGLTACTGTLRLSCRLLRNIDAHATIPPPLTSQAI